VKLRWRNPQRDEERDSELDAELQSHLNDSVRERTERGESPRQARDAARKEFGNLGIVKETTRAMWGRRWLDSLQQDLRFALRTLRKSPVFAATAIATLALAIGANTAIFSVIDSLILRPLPYTDASQLATINGHIQMGQGIRVSVLFSPDVWREVHDDAPAIQRMAFYFSGQTTLSGSSAPATISSAQVSGDFFPLLGVRPMLGRPIIPADTIPGNERVAVLNYKLWREVFGADRNIVGKQITLDEKPYTIVGVTPRDVDFAADGRGVWTALTHDPTKTSGNDDDSVYALVRMRPGVSMPALNEQLKTISSRVTANLPALLKRAELRGVALRNDRLASVNRGILILLGAVGFVLLIACVNVSNLLLARGWSRQREMAIRSALGASRGRLIRQLIAEGTTLALAGGLGALALGSWTLRIFRIAAPAEFLGNTDVRLDIRVLLFTVAISFVAGIAFALAPAWQISAADPRSAMSQAVGSGTGTAAFSKRPRTLRGALVVFEVALAMVLVFGAALLLRSFEKLMARETGIQTDHVLAVSAKLSKSICNRNASAKESIGKCNAATESILDHLRGLPGVDSAAAVSSIPLEPGSIMLSMEIEGRSGEVGLEQGEPIGYRDVSPGYFRSTGIRFLQGRDFRSSDTATSQNVAIVNEDFATKFLPGGAVGGRFRQSSHSPWIEIVGVVSASHDTELGHDAVPEYYIPLEQTANPVAADYMVRTGVDPMAIAPAVREQIWAVDKNAPVELRTLADVMREQEAEPHFRAILLTSFASLGLLLAMIGLYGVISYGVSQRTHEIGVRSALGAKPTDLLLMILREAMTLVVAGIVLGIAAGLALGRVLQNLLYEIKPGDPVTFVIVGIALALVGLAACYVPARRAMRVDPMQALRYE
jgi:predicted permease